jgi:hypothetical protein
MRREEASAAPNAAQRSERQPAEDVRVLRRAAPADRFEV